VADLPGRFGFAHAIVRDAVYEDLAPALRARLHAGVAALLRESLEAGGEATAAEASQHALPGAPDGLRARGIALARDLELPSVAAALAQATAP
jgi:hypothetical protein